MRKANALRPTPRGPRTAIGGLVRNTRLSAAFAIPTALIGAVTMLAPAAARAEAGDPLSDRVFVGVGTFLLNTSTRIRVDGEGGRGTEFNAERELGLHDSDSLRVDGYWRFAERHRVRVMYFDTTRSASKTIERDIRVGDTVFPVEALIDTRYETEVAEIAYEYSFLRGKQYEVGASIGIHNLRFGLSLNASENISGQSVVQAQTANADGPLPVIGLHGVWRLGDRFFLDGQAQFFKVSLKPYDGRLEDYSASIVWMAFRRAGVGVGYNEFVTRVDVESSNFNGRLRWRYGGARVFISASF
jgi:hypothetical protein